MTERYDNFANSTAPSATGAESYPFTWEHPVSWDQLEKFFQPVLQEATKKVISLLMENSKSLEDYLDGALLKVNGGSIYGNMSISGNLSVGGSITIPPSTVPLSPFPIGSVMQYAGSSAPSGWLFCDGTPYSQSAYSGLYAAIGTTYNTHCGQSAPSAGTFRVPNYKGRVLAGFDSGDGDFNALTDYGGAKTHTLTESEMPSHSHGMTPNASFNGTFAFADSATVTSLSQNNSFQTTSKGGGAAHNNMQPYAVVNYIIKY
jgi:microcystin-dependent protein